MSISGTCVVCGALCMLWLVVCSGCLCGCCVEVYPSGLRNKVWSRDRVCVCGVPLCGWDKR